jgi:hypothetical protein
LLSSAFWVYQALNDVYITTVKYPVKYTNLPLNKNFTGNPPATINVKLKGNGYVLLSNIINPPVLNLNLNDFALYSQSKDSMKVYMISRYALEWFSTEISRENKTPMEIISIEPDTISFDFTRTYAKKIPVKLRFKDENALFARQHMINGKILIEPDSITVIGPGTFIDTVEYAITKPIRISELKDTATKKVEIFQNNNIRYSATKAKITIPVDRFTESTKDIPISVKNSPDSIKVKVFPRTARITYKVTLSKYNLVSDTDFNPFVDYNDIQEQLLNKTPRLKVELDSTREYIYSVSIYPDNVEFLIELNNDKNRIDRGDR